MSEEFSNVCLSGGADGADLEWGRAAGRAGHSVIHWSYAGHRSQAAKNDIIELSAEQLVMADDHLIRANERVKRRVPFDKPWIINLLRRSYYQVCDADAVYAVGKIKNGEVQGGTAWAVALFCDLRPGPVYVFDQLVGEWFSLHNGNGLSR